jgi:hypothetical protein
MVFEKLAGKIAEHLGCEVGKITRDTTFESLGLIPLTRWKWSWNWRTTWALRLSWRAA